MTTPEKSFAVREQAVIAELDIDQIILNEQQSGFLDDLWMRRVDLLIQKAFFALREQGITMSSPDQILNRLTETGHLPKNCPYTEQAYRLLAFLSRRPEAALEDFLIQNVAEALADGRVDHSTLEIFLDSLPPRDLDPKTEPPDALFARTLVKKIKEQVPFLADPKDFLHFVLFRYLDNALKAKPRDLQKFKERFLQRYRSLLKKYSSDIERELGITNLQSTAEKSSEEVLLDAIIGIHTGERAVGTIIDETNAYVALAMVDSETITATNPYRNSIPFYEVIVAGYQVLQAQGKKMDVWHAARMMMRLESGTFMHGGSDYKYIAVLHLLEIDSLKDPTQSFNNQVEAMVVDAIAKNVPARQLKKTVNAFRQEFLERLDALQSPNYVFDEGQRDFVKTKTAGPAERVANGSTLEQLSNAENFRYYLLSTINDLWPFSAPNLALLIVDHDRRFGSLIDKYATAFAIPDFAGSSIPDEAVIADYKWDEVHLPPSESLGHFTPRQRLLYDAFVAYKKGAFQLQPGGKKRKTQPKGTRRLRGK